MGKRLNAGCGGNVERGYLNVDKTPMWPGVEQMDIDCGISCEDSTFEEVRCWGNLCEFRSDVVTIMSEFWRVLQNGGILDIKIAVVDNGIGAFRDPLARRYLNSQWVEYFYVGGAWENSGYGFGFKGKFEMVSNVVEGETQHVILRAIK